MKSKDTLISLPIPKDGNFDPMNVQKEMSKNSEIHIIFSYHQHHFFFLQVMEMKLPYLSIK